MVFANICKNTVRAVRLFLRARAVSDFLMRSSEHFRNYKWRAACWNLSLVKRFSPSYLADTFKTGQHKVLIAAVQPFLVAYSQLCLVS